MQQEGFRKKLPGTTDTFHSGVGALAVGPADALVNYSRTVPVSRLALASYRQHKDRFDPGNITIKRDIAARASANHKLTLATFHGPTDERTVGQDFNRPCDFADPLGRIIDVKPGHVIEESIEIIKYARRELHTCHAAV